MPSTSTCPSESETQALTASSTAQSDDRGDSCHASIRGAVAIAAPCFLEIVVAVRALAAEDEASKALSDDVFKRVVTLSGFSCSEAALEAANVITSWCDRWGHSRGLHNQRLPDVADKACRAEFVADKATNTEEPHHTAHSVLPVATDTEEPHHTASTPRSPACGSGNNLISELHDQETLSNGRFSSSGSPGRLSSSGSINTSGAAWSHECGSTGSTAVGSPGPRRSLSLHRDSFDLTNVLQQKRPKSGRKLWSLIGRATDDKNDKSDASGDEIDLSRWSALSEARETALLNKEPKSVTKRTNRLSLGSFSKAEEKAKKLIPRNVTYLGHCKTRSHTPPKSRRESEPSGCTVPGQLDMGLPSPRMASRNDSAVKFGAGKPSLLQILETASNTRDVSGV